MNFQVVHISSFLYQSSSIYHMKIIIDTTKNVFTKVIIMGVFLIILASVIAYARGYRFNPQRGTITSTGILSINSNPKAAKVFINGELRGATDTNITLPFGEYDIKVEKEGYTSWEKKVSLKGEIVMSVNAVIFSKNPSLTPLTNLGVNKAVTIENTDKIILVSQTGNIEKDGIYLFEPSTSPVTIFPPLKQLVLATALPETIDLQSAEFEFAPNHRQAILTFRTLNQDEIGVSNETSVIQDESTVSYLIALDAENGELFEVTASKENIIEKWHEEKIKEAMKIIETLPKSFQKIASDSFHIISVSPDEKKLMYLANSDGSLPKVIDPPLIGASQTNESRDLKSGKVYIYDKKEDKNFLIDLDFGFNENEETASQVDKLVKWYPTSDYIAIDQGDKIATIQYDGTNKEVVYAGPFEKTFYSISPDWNLMVVINLNPQINEFGDLYSVGIR